MTDVAASYGYADLKAIAKSMRRPLASLYGQSENHDPWGAEIPFRRAAAEWFATIWHSLDIQPGAHLRRIHYRLASQAAPVLRVNGEPYTNSLKCYSELNTASADARYLRLIDPTHLVDRRNPEATLRSSGLGVIYAGCVERSDGDASDGGSWDFAVRAEVDGGFVAPSFRLPELVLRAPHFGQPCAVEIWIEKTTMNDVLVPLSERYDCDFVSLKGESSITYCFGLADRAARRRVPTRVFVISDFDPAGQSIPLAIARKAEFRIRSQGLDADLQIRHIGLTADQVAEFNLPRIPINDVKRARSFEERHGEGGVELDALEALHPGLFGRMVEAEILRYRDSTLRRRTEKAKSDAEDKIDGINESVLAEWGGEIEDLQAECDQLEQAEEAVAALKAEMQEEMQQAVDAVLEQYRVRIDAIRPESGTPFAARAETVLDGIREALDDATPAIDDLADWPTPTPDDPADDPLYDSHRGYLDQIARYRKHQGRDANPTKKRSAHDKICKICGTKFQSRHQDAEICGQACRNKKWRQEHPTKCGMAGDGK
jgi:hypothetical protein